MHTTSLTYEDIVNQSSMSVDISLFEHKDDDHLIAQTPPRIKTPTFDDFVAEIECESEVKRLQPEKVGLL